MVKCLGEVLKGTGIEHILDGAQALGVGSKPVHVGGGTDGASFNVSQQNDMRGKLHAAMPWLCWAWCYAHCLELACKDASSSHLLSDPLEILMRLYYLYQKLPKKSRELLDIVTDLKEVFALRVSLFVHKEAAG